MKIRVNESEREVAAATTVAQVRQEVKPDADLTILNGFPCEGNPVLAEGDQLVLIRRGEAPSREEMETLICARHTPGVHDRVRTARVGVAGLGGLGSQVAVALARVGVGRLTLIDFDVVEPSNLNRQHYFVDQLGEPKPDALGQTLRRVNPYVKLDLHRVRLHPGNIAPLFGGCDAIIEAFDRADQKAMLVETALAALPGTPIIAASGLAGYGPSETLGVHRLGPTLWVVGDLESEARPFMGLMAPRVGVAAHMQANLALRLLLGEEP